MKIIHCADLHLDSKLETNLSAEKTRERKNEILLSFGKMVSYAKENNVSVIIIAGDMFDGKRVTIKTMKYVIDTINSANDIQFLYLCGNHDKDKLNFKDNIPENLKFFSSSWTNYNYDNVCICGVELNEINNMTVYDSLLLDENKYNIVVMHGQESSSFGEDNIKLSSLRGKNIDYLALGHIHKSSKATLDNRGIYAYSGCLEGRGFDECGEKGFFVLDTDNNSTEFVSISTRALYEISVDISNLESSLSILERINQNVSGIESKNMIKVVLTGSYTVDTQKDIPFLLKQLEDKFYFVKINDKTSMKIDFETYKNDISLKGEFIREVLGSKLDKDLQDKVISYGIKAINGEDID